MSPENETAKIGRPVQAVSASEIISFLNEIAETTLHLPSDHPAATIAIVGVETDEAARDGDLAWISPKVAELHPERITAFVGSLLIVPVQSDTTRPSDARLVVECEHPKLAFTRVTERFFGNLTTTEWPSADRARIPDAATIGAGVVLAAGVVIGSGVTIGDDVLIGPNTCIANASIANGVVIGANCTIGLPGFGYDRDAAGGFVRFPHLGRVVIHGGVEIGSNTCIDRGSLGDTVIGEGCKIDNLVHIAHNVVLGANVVVIANSMIGGSAHIDEGGWVAPSVAVRDQIRIGARSTLGLGAVVLKDVPDDTVVVGNPARPLERRPQA